MKICIVGNKGSFLNDVVGEFIDNDISVSHCYSDDIVNGNIEKILDISEASVLLYIGGETRFEDKMETHNFIIPKRLLNFCVESQLKFVYLSTLSVFGWNDNNLITIASQRQPYDYYGKTKNKFDAYRRNSGVSNFIALYPASIDAGRGRSSVEKFSSLMSSCPILKVIKLPGCLSVVSRKDLIKKIVDSCLSSEKTGDQLVSSHKQLSDFSANISVAFPRLPGAFFRVIKYIAGAKKAMLLKMLLQGVEYR
ncbi:hypothetical protein [Vibrio atlanticus]|uniref:hypothetical protein n=1 Tax=Vibrio atlanticus TaxID=693153 RepID=UPI003D0B5A38